MLLPHHPHRLDLSITYRKCIYVALKITTAHSSEVEHESKILEYLSNQDFNAPGRDNVTLLLDSFEHHGPNGIHRCLVFDVMGPTSAIMFSMLSTSLKGKCGDASKPDEEGRGRYPLWMAKSILRQTLLGLAYLYQHGIAHSDLQPGNILFSVKDLSSLSEDDVAHGDVEECILVKKINSNGEVSYHHSNAKTDPSPPLEEHNSIESQFNPSKKNTDDKKNDPSIPRYILSKYPMFEDVDLDPPLLVKISDLGGAFFVPESPKKPVTPYGLRSPELILGEPISHAQDIWSFGCLVFEFLTGRKLFSMYPPPPKDFYDNEDEAALAEAELNDDHLIQMAEMFAPVPVSFLARWPRSHLYFDEKSKLVRFYSGEFENEEDTSLVTILPPIEELLDREKGSDLSPDEADTVSKLLRTMLKPEPEKRPSASELLENPWFAG